MVDMIEPSTPEPAADKPASEPLQKATASVGSAHLAERERVVLSLLLCPDAVRDNR